MDTLAAIAALMLSFAAGAVIAVRYGFAAGAIAYLVCVFALAYLWSVLRARGDA